MKKSIIDIKSYMDTVFVGDIITCKIDDYEDVGIVEEECGGGKVIEYISLKDGASLWAEEHEITGAYPKGSAIAKFVLKGESDKNESIKNLMRINELIKKQLP
jgi:hypothetical protein